MQHGARVCVSLSFSVVDVFSDFCGALWRCSQRFVMELEFVQCLANPLYLQRENERP